MSNKILVTYASRAGSTKGVAEAIGMTLAEDGVQVDVRSMNEVKDLGEYRAVVAGSAVRGSKWLPEAMEFLKSNRKALAGKPFAAFLVCITLGMPNGEKYRPFVADFMKPVREIVKPASEGYFAGALDYSKVRLITDGVSLRILSAVTKTPERDYRDWEAIRTWAKELVPMVMA